MTAVIINTTRAHNEKETKFPLGSGTLLVMISDTLTDKRFY